MLKAYSPPKVLRSLDNNKGSGTVLGHEAAIQISPHIEQVPVLGSESIVGGQFQANHGGWESSRVTINPNHSAYRSYIDSGFASTRLGEFSAFFRERGVVPKTNELILSVLLHELGHVDDLQSYLEKAGGDFKAACMLSEEVRTSQLASLPLGVPSSVALAAWNHNTDGYRDQMQDAGYNTNDKWHEILTQNLRAYSELPCEKVADRFALGVLATIYS